MGLREGKEGGEITSRVAEHDLDGVGGMSRVPVWVWNRYRAL